MIYTGVATDSPNIKGGTIDGAVIGGVTPAPITGTALAGATLAVSGQSTLGATTLGATQAASIGAGGQVNGFKGTAAVTATAGATLTAAQIVAGAIMRSGPTAAYTDTTDTAANIIAAIPDAQVNTGFEFTIVNGVAFADTLAAGTGVTLSGTTAIAASAVRRYLLQITSITTPAVTITGLGAMTA